VFTQTYIHTRTHTFTKLFCFYRTSGDFSETEVFTCKQTALDRKKVAENFLLTGSH